MLSQLIFLSNILPVIAYIYSCKAKFVSPTDCKTCNNGGVTVIFCWR